MRRIAMGNNLGNPNSNLSESPGDLIYKGSLDSVIESDIHMKIAAWRNSNANSLVAEDMADWYKTEEGKNSDTLVAVWTKKLCLLKEKHNEEYLKLLEMLNQTKLKYSSMFQTMQSLYTVTNNEGFATKLDIQDGIANLENRSVLMHSIPLSGDDITDIEGLESRKELGIIPSEWFGSLEKYGECRFCTSFTKKQGSEVFRQNTSEATTAEQISDKQKELYSISFLIDADSPMLEPLLRLDFFAFVKKKAAGNIAEYTQEELVFLNQLYEWSNRREANDPILSNLNGSSGAGLSAANENPNWVAIPAGVSSKFIFGIVAMSPESQRIACEAGEIFGVPVMNKSGQVIHDVIEKAHANKSL